MREIIETVKKVANSDFRVREGPRRAGDPVEVVADARLIRKTFGWEPKLDDIEQIVRHAYAWELKMRDERFPSRAFTSSRAPSAIALAP